MSGNTPDAQPPAGVLSPPRGFRGTLTTDPEVREIFSRASGPFVLPPLAVARPVDCEDLALLVRSCASRGLPLIPRGAGTGMPAGNVGPALILDLSGPAFQSVSRVERDERSIRAGAGAIAAEVEARAADVGLTLPPLPSSARRCTLGGMASTNAAGARTFRHGAIREWITGLEFVDARGGVHRITSGSALPPGVPLSLSPTLQAGTANRIPGWPQVRKNSSGYALDRFLPGGDPLHLMVGSEGTLGIITSLTLSLSEQPTHRAVLLLALPTDDLVVEGVAMATRANASACEFLGRRLLELVLASGASIPGLSGIPHSVLLVELEGDAGTVAGNVALVRAEAEAYGLEVVEARDPRGMEALWGIRHAASPTIQAMAGRGLRSVQVIEDCVVPPARLPEFLRGIEEILLARQIDHVVFGHAGDGNIHVNPLVDLKNARTTTHLRQVLDETTTLVSHLGGTLCGEHGDGRLRAPLLHRIWAPAIIEAFQAVKSAFDPEGILNPGVILPLPGQDPLEGLGPAS